MPLEGARGVPVQNRPARRYCHRHPIQDKRRAPTEENMSADGAAQLAEVRDCFETGKQFVNV
jgi:hypothetical protein